MKHTHLLAILGILIAAPGAFASGVGLTQPRPATVVPVGYACPSGQCAAGAPCGCGSLGGACLDGQTPPACSADGVCIPKRSTFGFYNTRWRRWPGDSDQTEPTPTEAIQGDELLRPFDTPAPEKEDQQAPPPIEDDPGNTSAEEDDLPPLEIDLPPLPERRLFDAPAAPEDEGPPPLPFGMKSIDRPSMTWQPQDRGDEVREARRLPDLPTSTPRFIEPRRGSADRNGVAPPPLPGGFTLHRRDALPSLNREPVRVDAAVRPVSAVGPARVAVGE